MFVPVVGAADLARRRASPTSKGGILAPDGSTSKASARPPADIGVVIPAYNREHTIERAITSALEQSTPAKQIVVVDDGSTDTTMQKIESFGERVVAIRQANSGASIARNRGVEALGTPWLAFLDSDDYWTEHHLERMTNAIIGTQGAADLYFADTRRTEAEGSLRLWELAGFAIGAPYELTEDGTDWVMMYRQPMMLQSSMVRRSRYLELGGLAPTLRRRHDTHLFFRLGLGRPVCAVAEAGVIMTADDTSANRLTIGADSNSPEFAFHTANLYADLLAQYPELEPRHRDVLRMRMVDGCLKQASIALRTKHFTSAIRPLARAVRVDPVRVAQRAVRVNRNRRPNSVT